MSLKLDQTTLAKIEELWVKVFDASNVVLRQASHYGFDRMSEASPNLEDIVSGLAMLDAVIGVLLATHEGLDWDQQRPLHNAKEQVSRMRRLLGALHANDRRNFDEILLELEKQFVG